MDGGVLVAVLTAAGVLLGGAGKWAYDWLTARHAQKKQDQADTIGEWREIVKTLTEQHDLLQVEVRQFREAYMKCQVESAELRGEVRSLRASIEQVVVKGTTP